MNVQLPPAVLLLFILLPLVHAAEGEEKGREGGRETKDKGERKKRKKEE